MGALLWPTHFKRETKVYPIASEAWLISLNPVPWFPGSLHCASCSSSSSHSSCRHLGTFSPALPFFWKVPPIDFFLIWFKCEGSLSPPPPTPRTTLAHCLSTVFPLGGTVLGCCGILGRGSWLAEVVMCAPPCLSYQGGAQPLNCE